MNELFKASRSDIQFCGMKNINISISPQDNIRGSLVRDILNLMYASTVIQPHTLLLQRPVLGLLQ